MLLEMGCVPGKNVTTVHIDNIKRSVKNRNSVHASGN